MRFYRLTGCLCAAILLVAGVALATQFGGVGLQVAPTVTGELVVLRVVEASPAARAGLLPGDLVTAIDGDTLRGKPFEETVQKRLRGPVGSTLTLDYLRPGVAGSGRLTLERRLLTRPEERLPGVKMLVPDEKGDQ